MKKIIVLGSGLVGSVMANDLAKNYEVTSVDISTKNLEKIQSEKINKLCADVSEKDVLENLIKNFDLVVGALPGFMGYNIMKRVIEAKKNIVDISFYSEDPFDLDKIAKENNELYGSIKPKEICSPRNGKHYFWTPQQNNEYYRL